MKATGDAHARRRWMIGRLGIVGLVTVLGAAALDFVFGVDRRPAHSPDEPGDSEVPTSMTEQTPWFCEVPKSSGLDVSHRNGEEAGHFSILESFGGGVALLDFDGDGALDIFVVGGGFFDGPKKNEMKGHPCQLFRNEGNWTFRNVTAEANLDLPWWYTQGCAVSDFDRDGWPDLLVTGYGRVGLFHNQPDHKKGRRFIDVTHKVGLNDRLWSTSAGWADLDGDGFPELYICHYADWSLTNNPACGEGRSRAPCVPTTFQPLVHELYKNEGGKSFRSIAAEQKFKASGRGLGVVLLDLNADARPDIYVANDLSENFLFFNRGGRLEEKGVSAGVAVDDLGKPNGSMGVDAADYDGSGRPSLFVTNFQGELNALYRNLGREVFDYRSRACGLAALGINFVGFGTGFLDVDNDGWEDMAILNGHVNPEPTMGGAYRQRALLMRNTDVGRGRTFRDASWRSGRFFQEPALGRGLAIGDLDNDGWPDLIASRNNAPVVCLRNQAASTSSARWLGIRLVGQDYRDVVGSTIILEAGARRWTRFAKGGGSYLSANDPRILFGLGPADPPVRLTVQWSWGKSQVWDNLEPDSYWELHENKPTAKRLGPRASARVPPEATNSK